MGMDFVSIINNRFSKSEILKLPEIIDDSIVLREMFEKQHINDVKRNPNHYNRRSNWNRQENRIMNESNLQRIWNHLKEDTSVENIEGMCHDTNISTYFGWIYIYENTMSIKLFPEHKYGNLRNPNSSKYVFEFIREIAKLFGSDEILYCCDSYYQPSILEEKSMMGLTVQSIIV